MQTDSRFSGAGVIGDITTSSERGSLVGIFGGGNLFVCYMEASCPRKQADKFIVRMLGQGIGPVIGGLLTKAWGFRSIFWFLTICAGVSTLLILILLPETLRPIAGNGTVPLKGIIHKPFIYMVVGQKDAKETAEPGAKKSKVKFRTVVSPLTFLFEKDVFVTLFFGAIIYTFWSMVTSSTTALFQDAYDLNSLEIGLTFLGNGKILSSLPSRYLLLDDEATLTHSNQVSDVCPVHTSSATLWTITTDEPNTSTASNTDIQPRLASI